MALADDLARIAPLAAAHARDGERLLGILVCEAEPGLRTYVCALGTDDRPEGWVALADDGEAVVDRARVRDAVAVAALCEVAAETAWPGDLDELRAQLVQVRLTESPPGIEEAEAAAAGLQRVLGAPPVLATPQRLDEIGAAARRLETALAQPGQGSPFTAALAGAQGAVDELWSQVEAGYRLPLEDATRA